MNHLMKATLFYKEGNYADALKHYEQLQIFMADI